MSYTPVKVDEPIWVLGNDGLGTKMWVEGYLPDSDTIVLRSVQNPKKFYRVLKDFPAREIGNRLHRSYRDMQEAKKHGAPWKGTEQRGEKDAAGI